MIGKKIGFSGKTVEREFLVLIGKFLKANDNSGDPGASIKVVMCAANDGPAIIGDIRFGSASGGASGRS